MSRITHVFWLGARGVRSQQVYPARPSTPPVPTPYLVAEPDLAAPDERVDGTIISVADDDYAIILAQLDGLEGYTEGGTANLYERLLVTVDTAAGPCVAWVYVAGTENLARIRAGDLPKVPDGNWQSDPAALRYWSTQ